MAFEHNKSEVWKMFNQISSTYDKINRILSLGIDRHWRNKMARFLPEKDKISLLDCATGTGNQLFALMEKSSQINRATGVDLAKEMLQIGKKKLRKKHYANLVSFQEASVLELPFLENSFDCATISFGIRNTPDVGACLKEMQRVLTPKGRLLILEFSLPSHPIIKRLHLWYLRHLVPTLGGFISKNKNAYTYLNETIESFPHGQSFCRLLETSGFKNVSAHPLTFGIVTIYQGDK